MKAIADTMGVARSHLVERTEGGKAACPQPLQQGRRCLAVALDPRTCGLPRDLRIQKDLRSA